MVTKHTLTQLGYALIGLTVFIILWGAWVRVSGSGAGCGDHWPLCNGEFVPVGAGKHTWIEFFHRGTTGIFGILVVIALILTFKVFPKGHPTRWWAVLVLIFTITEALIGAQLVLLRLVDRSTADARLLIMPLHLINTFALLFVEVRWLVSLNNSVRLRALPTAVRVWWGTALITLTIIAAAGALASLAAHLYPSESLLEGLAKEFSANTPLLLKLRTIHPVIAILGGLLTCFAFAKLHELSAISQRDCIVCCSLVGVMLAVGFATLLLLSPVVLKLVHLAVGVAVWGGACWGVRGAGQPV